MIFKEVGDTAKAVSSFQTAVENNPDYYEAYLQLGMLYYSILDPLALNYLDNAINLNPKSVIGLYTKAMYFQKTDDIDMAIKKMVNSNADSCVSVNETKKSPYWMYSISKDQKLVSLYQDCHR